MKLLLTAVNAKYAHTSLGIKSIESYLKKSGFAPGIAEFTINDSYFDILHKILDEKPEIIGFSCYIWNLSLIASLCADIKEISPGTLILIGGPEASYNEEILKITGADYAILGEGELPLLSVIRGDFGAKGIWDGKGEREFADVLPLDEIPFCYENLPALKNKAVYYETSRGCPFSCSFCISSLTRGVRTLSLSRVFKELKMFADAGIKRVKLVDRTFNADRRRAYEIFQFIIDNTEGTCFHFEIGADLLDDKTIELLKTAKEGQIQFEAGIQSTDGAVLAAVDRKTDMDKLKHNIKELKKCRIHLHIDLIAGLPFETFEGFKNSFNEAYSLKADMLQLGFLKLLHGSKIRREADKYNYKFRSAPPYEVLGNDFISFEELMKLKTAEEALDIFGNKGFFKNSLNYLFENNDIPPFEVFFELGKQIDGIRPSHKELYFIINDYYINKKLKNYEQFNEYLKLDYFLKNRGVLPPIFKNYKTKELVRRWVDEYAEKTGMSKNEISRRLDFELFVFDGKEVVMHKEN